MPLRTDTNRGGLVPLASSWRVGFQKTGYTVDHYVNVEELLEDEDVDVEEYLDDEEDEE